MALCQIDEGDFYAWFSLNQIAEVPQALCSFSQFDYSMMIIKMPSMMACEGCCFLVVEMKGRRVTWFIFRCGQTVDPASIPSIWLSCGLWNFKARLMSDVRSQRERAGLTFNSRTIDCLYPYVYNCTTKQLKQQRGRDAARLQWLQGQWQSVVFVKRLNSIICNLLKLLLARQPC